MDGAGFTFLLLQLCPSAVSLLFSPLAVSVLLSPWLVMDAGSGARELYPKS